MNTVPIVSFFVSMNLTRFFENILPHECFLVRFAKVKHPRINLGIERFKIGKKSLFINYLFLDGVGWGCSDVNCFDVS